MKLKGLKQKWNIVVTSSKMQTKRNINLNANISSIIKLPVFHNEIQLRILEFSI